MKAASTAPPFWDSNKQLCRQAAATSKMQWLACIRRRHTAHLQTCPEYLEGNFSESNPQLRYQRQHTTVHGYMFWKSARQGDLILYSTLRYST